MEWCRIVHNYRPTSLIHARAKQERGDNEEGREGRKDSSRMRVGICVDLRTVCWRA